MPMGFFEERKFGSKTDRFFRLREWHNFKNILHHTQFFALNFFYLSRVLYDRGKNTVARKVFIENELFTKIFNALTKNIYPNEIYIAKTQ